MSATPADPKIITFGCRLNAYESEVMRAHARAAGLTDAVIVNTCAVTSEAERQARQAIRKARREHPHAHLIVTGCAAQIDPAAYAAMPEVDRVVGNAEKLAPATFAPETDHPRVLVDDIMSVRETAGHLIHGFEGRTRAFVQVQQGCDHRCTFCIIPFGRGPSRSVPLGEVVRQVRALVAAGTAEVVLSGVDITDYGKDLPGRPGLGQLVRRLLALVPELPRLRISSVDPVELDEALLRLLAEEERLMPHLHLSLQAGDDLILKRMKRRHLRADALALCRRVRRLRPDVVFGADLIAGFPTEDEAMFANTLSLVEDCGLTHLHVFPYSPRPGTPAARMPQVPAGLRKERAARLRGAGDAALARFLESRVGATERVLVERPDFGHSEQFAPVTLDPATPGEVAAVHVSGEIVTAHVSGVADGRLLARAAA
ncbi:MAG: tRNA (N(6)-L-threonylcarbamoyladenosine(37)-C(2))-methylthiotransferase MtaB, partial [Kiloniellales bacterium]